MEANTRKVYESIRDAMVTSLTKLSGDDYKDVLENLSADIDGMLDAHREENEPE
jgi:hypothetical protein